MFKLKIFTKLLDACRNHTKLQAKNIKNLVKKFFFSRISNKFQDFSFKFQEYLNSKKNALKNFLKDMRTIGVKIKLK